LMLFAAIDAWVIHRSEMFEQAGARQGLIHGLRGFLAKLRSILKISVWYPHSL
jgi:hypothetical protein